MTATAQPLHTSETPGGGKPTPPRVTRKEPTPERPADQTTAKMDLLFNDLDTYRYVPQVPLTPAMARRLIDLNAVNNRDLQPSRAALYLRDMLTGRWREQTGQSVKIGSDGRLLDGNTRMHALAQSGLTLKFDLCFGVNPEDILVMDSHRPRSTRDQIKVAGGVDPGRAGPIVKRIFAWDRGAYMGVNGSTTATPIEVAETYQKEMGLFDAAAKRGGDCQSRNLGAGAIAGQAYVLFARLDKEAAEAFFDVLVPGLFGERGQDHAVYHLRELLIRRKQKKLTSAEQLAAYIRAWNRHHTLADGQRKPVSNLQITRRAANAAPGEDSLTNANFPQPKKAVWLPGER